MLKSWRLLAAFFTMASLPAAAQQYKFAIIGLLHSHYGTNLPRMLKNPDVKVVGIAETIPELVAEAKQMGASDVPFFDDYRKMLDQTRPDVVWAYVENNRRLEIAREVAPRGIHLMYEKTLAANYKDALAIAALARKYGIKVLCNYQMAWWAASIAAKKQVDSGAIGKPWRLHGVVGTEGPGSEGTLRPFFNWLTDPVKNGGGALIDFGCYNALWSLWYMGRPESVYAEAIHLRPETFPKVEDSVTLMLRYPQGINVFEGSWDLPRTFHDLEVFGSSTGPDGKLVRGSVYMTQQKLEVRTEGGQVTDIPLRRPPAPEADPIAYMVSVLKNNKPLEGIVALDINVGVMEILDAARESIRTGRAVTLPPAR
jgi:predicted dehydrogenase